MADDRHSKHECLAHRNRCGHAEATANAMLASIILLSLGLHVFSRAAFNNNNNDSGYKKLHQILKKAAVDRLHGRL